MQLPTFAEALATVIAIHAPNWKDRQGSERQWHSRFATYALPRIGGKTVDAVTNRRRHGRAAAHLVHQAGYRRVRKAARRRGDEVGRRAGPACR